MPTATEVEKMAAGVFEAMRMAVHRARNSTVKRGNTFVAQANDIFGVFDLIVIDPVTGDVYFYQVTRSRNAASARRKKIQEWIAKYRFTNSALKKVTPGILIYDTQKSRKDPRRKDRFFYREHYEMTVMGYEWRKLSPLEVTFR